MDEDWEVVQTFLPEGWRELAAETGALKGLRKDRSPEALLLHLACGHSLRETVARARISGLAELSDVALLKRLRKSREAIRVARRKLRGEAARRDRQPRPETLEFARHVIVFTTFPEAGFPAADVLEWYRARWQVALVFKRFKSLAQLGHLPKRDDGSAKAWLHGKLLLVALLTEKLIRHASAVSPWGYRMAATPDPQSLA